MSFDAEALRAARLQFEKLGRAAVYSPAGGGTIETTVIVGFAVEQYPSDTQRMTTGPIPEIAVKLEDVESPGRGDEVLVGDGSETLDGTYRVDGELENDGYVATLRVRKITGS